jgi:hypothetical protein
MKKKSIWTTIMLIDWERDIQTCLTISCSIISLLVSLLVIRFVSEQHGSWSDCADAQAGLDPCWSQTHYAGFVMTRLIYNINKENLNKHITFSAQSQSQHTVLTVAKGLFFMFIFNLLNSVSVQSFFYY